MRYALILAAVPALLALGACETTDRMPEQQVGIAKLQFADGRPAGTANIYNDGTRVWVSANLKGFTPGEHGFHLHTTGKCEGPNFTSAGGHLNPAGKEHGLKNPEGAHLGDMPNLTIAADGTGSTTATLVGDAAFVMSSIFDSDGTAVMVHAMADDNMSDPAGNAGSRMACGVVTRT
jgi:Cu-Zn family superoxide dismutase